MATKDPFALEPIPRRVTHLIFMVDTSGSMSGSKIASLNTAVRDALDDVGDTCGMEHAPSGCGRVHVEQRL